eukprot:gnl/MRDRNA2_/MRDRNA2_128645_c0_seq1.p1 gnl/MRDRNA2_/MRDRNA2_128645_c0~~gnl/MRDRNA2_/MRDRNA2_128645_c0_seq1.p1  ORF type:complete len:272 (+),score=35.63 gnl/MRDRNA2_/MRDRNA2_128645_c0_seq1:87-902(+)
MGMKEKEQPVQALPRFVPTLPRSYAQTKIPAVPCVPLLDAKRRERGDQPKVYPDTFQTAASPDPSLQRVPSLKMPSSPMLDGVGMSPRDDLLNTWGKAARSRSPDADRSRASGRSPPRWPHPRPTSPRPVLQDFRERRDEGSPDCRWPGSTSMFAGMPQRPLTGRMSSPRLHSPTLSPRRALMDSVLCSPRQALPVSNEVVTRLRRCASEQHVQAPAPGANGSSPDLSKPRTVREERLLQSFRSPAYRNAAKSATSLAKRTKPKKPTNIAT